MISIPRFQFGRKGRDILGSRERSIEPFEKTCGKPFYVQKLIVENQFRVFIRCSLGEQSNERSLCLPVMEPF